MQLLEFQAKQLLRTSGLPVPSGHVMRTADHLPDVTLPVVVKSQVPVGGRGKLGGVKLVQDSQGLQETVERIANLSIKGHLPSHLLLEEALDIERELYISLQVNRDDRRVEWIASENGGVEIESHSGSVLIIDQKLSDAHEKLSHILGVNVSVLSPLLQQLEQCFFDNDLLLLEVNPLVVTASGSLVCADAKVIVDDNAKFRHSALPWPEPEHIKRLGGTIGVIANGAGMAMSTMDAIYAAGGKPANFLDIGGGTGEDVFIRNIREINALPGLTSIVVNIFAGITRCDDIARGLIAAKKQIKNLVPLFIRLEGTNKDEAATLLAEANITLQPDLKSCITQALNTDKESLATKSPLLTADLTSRGVRDAISLRVEDQPLGRPQGSSADTKEMVKQTTSREESQQSINGTQERSESASNIFASQPTIVQGITGHHGMFHTEKMLETDTDIVAGVTPGKGGQVVHGVPVYNTVQEAVAKHHATTSVIFVPAPFAKAAAFEAMEAGIRLVVIITEGIPVHDMLAIHEQAIATNTTVVGPNCPGVIVPGSHKLGIIASHITAPGHTTIISRSGTLTYELADALTKRGIGQRFIIGIGGDPIQGMTFCDALRIAEDDPGTEQIVIVGEIGGEGEIRAARFIDEHVTKPVYGLVVGHSLPPGQTFGHAGAIVSAKAEDAATKTAYLASCGALMADTLDELIDNIVT